MPELRFWGESAGLPSRIALTYLYRPGTPWPENHLGVLFRVAPDQFRVLHLEWHHRLAAENVSPAEWTMMVEPALEQETTRVLARLCSLVETKYGQGGRSLAYALRYQGGRFDPTTGDFLSEGGLGLTCATFVMAIFASYGAGLLKAEEWGPREEDRQWEEYIVATLRRTKADPMHIQAVEQEILCKRFRPQEVTAAATLDELPAGFAYCSAKAMEILEAKAMEILELVSQRLKT